MIKIIICRDKDECEHKLRMNEIYTADLIVYKHNEYYYVYKNRQGEDGKQLNDVEFGNLICQYSKGTIW